MSEDDGFLGVISILMTWVADAVEALIILGGCVGTYFALTASVALWKAMQEPEGYSRSSPGQLLAAVIVGSMMTIFAVIVGWFSLFYSSNS